MSGKHRIEETYERLSEIDRLDFFLIRETITTQVNRRATARALGLPVSTHAAKEA